jgi:hypothetical protein
MYCSRLIRGPLARSLRSLSRDHRHMARHRWCVAAGVDGGGEDGVAGLIAKGSRLTTVAHQIWKLVLKQGDIVCDATCGNGYDSVYLAQEVGPSGRLVCIDIQQEAIDATKNNIEASIEVDDRPAIDYVVGSHANVTDFVGSNVAKLVCFNLGYLPGGNKSIVTQIDSTIAAIEGSLECLCSGGLVSLLCYTGHDDGEEFGAVQEFVGQLSPRYWLVSQIQLLNAPSAPVMVLIWKRD